MNIMQATASPSIVATTGPTGQTDDFGAARAWDGQLNTFYQHQTNAGWQKNGGWTQAEFDCSAIISQIRYYPRGSKESRANGGQFKCITSSGVSETLHTIGTAASGWTTVSVSSTTPCKHLTYQGADGTYSTMAEIEPIATCLAEAPCSFA